MASIGIDLGTTNSVASIVRAGKPEVIRSRDDSLLTPSVVSCRKLGGTEEFLVGIQAVNFAEQAPEDTVYSIKRVMGLDYNNQKVEELNRRVPYRICSPKDAEDIGVRVLMGDKEYTPIEVSAMILRHIKEDCQHVLSQPIDGATITVPAYFLDNQRNATKEAGELAGLRLRPLLNEPIAASLAFGADEKCSKGERLLVFDLGGGTFDVSIVQIAGDNIQVLDTVGDMWLGGDDFDHTIEDRIHRWIHDKYRVEVVHDAKARRRIKLVAEKAKKALSDKASFQILEPFLTHHPDKGAISLDFVITRNEFESDITEVVRRSIDLVEESLQRTSLTPNDLTNVLLAGGSTKVPLVRRELARRFGESKIRDNVDPMHCVSLGAALWNERFPVDKSGKISLAKFDQTGLPVPMELGVEIYLDGNQHSFSTIIARGTTYPTPKGHYKGKYYPTSDNQRLIRLPIFQGNSSITTYNSCQGIVNYELPSGIPAKTPVWVGFNIDEHGNLEVDIEVQGFPDYRGSWKIERNQPVVSVEEREQHLKWKEDLRQSIDVGRYFLQNFEPYFIPADRDNLTQLLEKGRHAVEQNERTTGSSVCQAITLAMMGSGTASDLFLAQRAQEMADKNVAREIARARVALERAYREKNARQVREISDALKLAVHRVIEVKTGPSSGGPGRGQVTGESG